MRVAVSGRREQKPSFFTVIVWRGQAEHAAESLAKGSRVVVVGPFDRKRLRGYVQAMLKVKIAFTVLLMVSLLGIAACSNDDGDEGGTSAKEGSEPILIKTRVAPQNARGETSGEVLSGSTIGTSAFCAGGSFIDGPEKPPLGSVERIFRCSGGTLTITFTTTQSGLEQRGDWKVVEGFGRFEGLGGGGQMTAVFESGRGGGRETLTGTITR